MNDSKPSILVVSNNIVKPRSLVESITQNSILKEDGPHRLSQTWKIDTKYYTAEVDIHIVNEHYERNDDFNQAIAALIIYIDCNTDTELVNLSKWISVENECNPEVKLLVSDYCNDKTKVTSNTITEWCINHDYEFITLHPTVEKTVQEEDEIIKEKFGVDRIIEALHTYIWPNLEMKTTQKNLTNQKKSDILSNEEINDVSLDDILLEDGMDDFTELFGQLHMMKESIQTMSGGERKYHAEQMVTAFWKAIGGDDEEIGDL